MAVTFSDILTRYAMQEINDEYWNEELALSPARFFRAKSDLLIDSIPLFSRPPEAQEWLSFQAPTYGDYLYMAESDQMAPFIIETGMKGYELCSAVIATADATGEVAETAVASDYDPETGNVTIKGNVLEGQQVDMDFYTDGVFDYDLDYEQCHILALCIAYTWMRRFGNDLLNIQPKIRDKTFDIASESAHMTAVTARKKEDRTQLNDALLRYEQNLMRRQTIPQNHKLKPPKRNQTPPVKPGYVPLYVKADD